MASASASPAQMQQHSPVIITNMPTFEGQQAAVQQQVREAIPDGNGIKVGIPTLWNVTVQQIAVFTKMKPDTFIALANGDGSGGISGITKMKPMTPATTSAGASSPGNPGDMQTSSLDPSDV